MESRGLSKALDLMCGGLLTKHIVPKAQSLQNLEHLNKELGGQRVN